MERLCLIKDWVLVLHHTASPLPSGSLQQPALRTRVHLPPTSLERVANPHPFQFTTQGFPQDGAMGGGEESPSHPQMKIDPMASAPPSKGIPPPLLFCLFWRQVSWGFGLLSAAACERDPIIGSGFLVASFYRNND